LSKRQQRIPNPFNEQLLGYSLEKLNAIIRYP